MCFYVNMCVLFSFLAFSLYNQCWMFTFQSFIFIFYLMGQSLAILSRCSIQLVLDVYIQSFISILCLMGWNHAILSKCFACASSFQSLLCTFQFDLDGYLLQFNIVVQLLVFTLASSLGTCHNYNFLVPSRQKIILVALFILTCSFSKWLILERQDCSISLADSWNLTLVLTMILLR